ncbi:hypothetical protein [Sphingomonas oryzagri]
MKTPILMLAFSACVSNATQVLGAPAPSPILGRWKVDLAAMPIPAQARPKAVTAEFADAGDGFWRTTYVITGRDGSERRMTSRERLDGKAVPIEGDTTEADSVAMSTPSPGVLVMGLGKDGRPGSVRTYTVAPDGRWMTESAASIGDDGKPVVRTFSWVR